jgi:hypothetical protein
VIGKSIKCGAGCFEEILGLELVSRKTDGREFDSLADTARPKEDHLRNGLLHEGAKNGDIAAVSGSIVAFGRAAHLRISGLIHVFGSGDIAANSFGVGEQLLRLFGRPKTLRIARARTSRERSDKSCIGSP